MHPTNPQNPFHVPIAKTFLTEEELNAPISVVKIKVFGSYTKRGEHRKEVVEDQFDATVEVPHNFNIGHVKLACNRYVREIMKPRGIRVRVFKHDETIPPEPCEYQRRVRDFMSAKGLRDNARQKRAYDREIEKRKAEMDSMAAGALPQFMDTTAYGSDGLAPINNDKQYVS